MLFEIFCVLSVVKLYEFVLVCVVVFLMIIVGSEISLNFRKKMIKFKNINYFRKRKNDIILFLKRFKKI